MFFMNGENYTVCNMLTSENKLGDRYSMEGDIIYLHALGKSFVVLNSAQAATDLLDKRSSNYSDRPEFPVFEMFSLSFIKITLLTDSLTL
jgi:hypothetical protein